MTVALPGLGLSPAGRVVHAVFKRVNRATMVPLLRAGLGAWVGTPIGGYLLLLRVRGRRSGRTYEVPLSYCVTEGAAWVVAGFGPATQWYRNLLAVPEVEVVLPGRTLACTAVDVRDPETRRRVLPRLVRAVGLPALLGGADPLRATDQAIMAAYGSLPLVRFSPVTGAITPGPDDPGGRAWLWRQSLMLGATLLVAAGAARTRRFRTRPRSITRGRTRALGMT